MNVFMYSLRRVYILAGVQPQNPIDFIIKSRGMDEWVFHQFVLSLRIYRPVNWSKTVHNWSVMIPRITGGMGDGGGGSNT